MEKLTRYRFEAVVQDTTEHRSEYLTNEFINILESNKPYQSKADYIGYSILSIDEKISLLDDEIENLKTYKQKQKGTAIGRFLHTKTTSNVTHSAHGERSLCRSCRRACSPENRLPLRSPRNKFIGRYVKVIASHSGSMRLAQREGISVYLKSGRVRP
jgi:hypothetical protein